MTRFHTVSTSFKLFLSTSKPYQNPTVLLHSGRIFYYTSYFPLPQVIIIKMGLFVKKYFTLLCLVSLTVIYYLLVLCTYLSRCLVQIFTSNLINLIFRITMRTNLLNWNNFVSISRNQAQQECSVLCLWGGKNLLIFGKFVLMMKPLEILQISAESKKKSAEKTFMTNCCTFFFRKIFLHILYRIFDVRSQKTIIQ